MVNYGSILLRKVRYGRVIYPTSTSAFLFFPTLLNYGNLEIEFYINLFLSIKLK